MSPIFRYFRIADHAFSSLFSPSAQDILQCILGFMPPAISATSLNCAYRKRCRMGMTSTCTFCSIRFLQACRFTPRLAQKATTVSLTVTQVLYLSAVLRYKYYVFFLLGTIISGFWFFHSFYSTNLVSSYFIDYRLYRSQRWCI